MGRFAPQFRTLAVQCAQLSRRALQFFEAALRSRTIARRVAGCAVYHAVDEEFRQDDARRTDRERRCVGALKSEGLQLFQHGEVQVAPLTHRLA